MKIFPVTLALALCASALPLSAAADTLLIERVRAEAAVTLPGRGQTMASVEARHGAPVVKHPPIAGPNARRYNPPITRWDYPGFSVYFEYSHVVDAVAHKSSPVELGPKPVR